MVTQINIPLLIYSTSQVLTTEIAFWSKMPPSLLSPTSSSSPTRKNMIQRQISGSLSSQTEFSWHWRSYPKLDFLILQYLDFKDGFGVNWDSASTSEVVWNHFKEQITAVSKCYPIYSFSTSYKKIVLSTREKIANKLTAQMNSALKLC